MPGYWRCKISHTEIPTAGAHTSCLGPRPMLPSSGVCDHVCEVRYFHHYFFSHHFLWSNWPTLYVDMYRSCSEDTWRGESLELGLENLTLPKCWTHEIWAPGISKFGSFMGMLKKKEHIKRRGRCVLSYLFILIDKQCFSFEHGAYTHCHIASYYYIVNREVYPVPMRLYKHQVKAMVSAEEPGRVVAFHSLSRSWFLCGSNEVVWR